MSEGKIIDEFFRLKSKIYSIKNIDDEESNTEKWVNIATEFNEFKETLFNKKVVRHKMKRIQSKKHKIEICGWWQRICFKLWYLYPCIFS